MLTSKILEYINLDFVMGESEVSSDLWLKIPVYLIDVIKVCICHDITLISFFII